MTTASSTFASSSPSQAGEFSFINVVADGVWGGDSWGKAPKTRKRITKQQLEALEDLFRVHSHPSREERQMIALKTGMELRSVTIWLQNKRQIIKKTAKVITAEGGASASSSPPSSAPSPQGRPPRTTASPAPTDDTTPRGPAPARPTLDRVASLSEFQSPVRPITVKKQPEDAQPLWSHMPSSPPNSPPPIPHPPKRTRSAVNASALLHKVAGRPYPPMSRTMSVDSARTANSSSSRPREPERSRLGKPSFTLEWACAQASARPAHEDDGALTEEEDSSSSTLSQASQNTDWVKQDEGMKASSDEIQAALALCGLLHS